MKVPKWFSRMLVDSHAEAKNVITEASSDTIREIFESILWEKLQTKASEFPEVVELLEFYSKGDGKVYDFEVMDSYFSPEVKGWKTGRKAKEVLKRGN